jgi:hypothetical protein
MLPPLPLVFLSWGGSCSHRRYSLCIPRANTGKFVGSFRAATQAAGRLIRNHLIKKILLLFFE